MPVAQQLRRLDGPVSQARLALLLRKALPVQLVSAPLVDIQQGEMGLIVHLACLEGQVVEVKNLYSGLSAL